MKNTDPATKANLLFCTLDDLPLEGYEASFKMMRYSLLNVRFLIGVKTKNLSRHHFENMCKKLNMPDTCFLKCMEKFNDSNLVLFGFEEDRNHCTYKIYLEFNDRNRSIVRQTKSKEPLIQYLGFKWDAFDNLNFLITTYKWFPFISASEMYDRIDQIYMKTDPFQFILIKNLIQSVVNRIDDSFDPFIYLEATDMNNKRKSFDLNIYKAGLTMGEVETYIKKIMRLFDIDARKWNMFLWKIRHKIFGHISSGFSFTGDEFASFYYDVLSDQIT
jgi:hypothetical protein